MRKIIMMVAMLGMAGGAYAGTAAEQLGLDGDIVAIRLPVGVPEPVKASPSKGGDSLKAKMAELERMFNEGTPVPQSGMASSYNGRAAIGTIILEDANNKTMSNADIIMRVSKAIGPDLGPLWPGEVIGFDYAVTISLPFQSMMYGTNVVTSPQSNIVSIRNNKGVMQNDGSSMNIVLRRNGKYIVGSMRWETPLTQTVTQKETGFFYLY
jgi:hypothetical protein